MAYCGALGIAVEVAEPGVIPGVAPLDMVLLGIEDELFLERRLRVLDEFMDGVVVLLTPGVTPAETPVEPGVAPVPRLALVDTPPLAACGPPLAPPGPGMAPPTAPPVTGPVAPPTPVGAWARRGVAIAKAAMAVIEIMVFRMEGSFIGRQQPTRFDWIQDVNPPRGALFHRLSLPSL